MRRISIIILLIISVGLGWWIFYGPNTKTLETPIDAVTLINPTGPTVIPVAALAAQKVETPVGINIEYWKNTDEAVASLAAGKSDFAVLPVTTAANINAQGIELVLLGVHEWKVFYMIARQENLYNDIASLKGEKVYTPNGRGTTVDILLRSAVAGAGLDPDSDVKIVYASPQEIVALFKAGKIEYAALPEPFVTMAIAGADGKIVLDFQKYWGDLSKGSDRIPVAGLFVKKDFYAAHPAAADQVADSLLESTEWSNNNIEQALELTSDLLPVPAKLMQEALTRTDFYYIPIQDCQSEVELFLHKMQELYPEGLPQIPEKEFYAQ